MSQTRLSLALAGPDVAAGAWPADGRVLVLGAPSGIPLDPLDRGRTTVVQGFRPDHDALAADGWTVTPVAEGRFDAAVVFVPRARSLARARIALAVAHVAVGAPVWVDGQKTDGIDPVLKDLQARVPLSAPVAKAHGKAAWFAAPGPEVFADWIAVDTRPAPGFVAAPGSFSADAPDPGSVLLASALPADLKGRVADLGAGWGWLSAEVLTRPSVRELHLVEADHDALASARRNVTDARAMFHWADARLFRPAVALDAVVMNPPFHEGREGDPKLGVAFILAAARMLAPHGALYMVANRHLPYEQTLRNSFRQVDELAGTGAFKVFRAAHPVRERTVQRPARRAR